MNTRLVKTFGQLKLVDIEFVTYVVQGAFFIEYNYSLAAAIKLSHEHGLPLRVIYYLDVKYPFVNTRNINFLFEGLKAFDFELETNLEIVVEFDDMREILGKSLVVTDNIHSSFQSTKVNSYLDKKKIYTQIYENTVIVPVDIAYPKLAYSAYVIRKSLISKIDNYIHEISDLAVPSYYKAAKTDFDKLLKLALKDQEFIEPILNIGGCTLAKVKMHEFVLDHLCDYNCSKKVNLLKPTSHMSGFLSQGHISPIMVLKMAQFQTDSLGFENFLEQLVVRREVCFNYTYYSGTQSYSFTNIPNWAKISIEEHRGDTRVITFSESQIINAQTTDFAFNACQTQLLKEGFMHNHMRMYWAKAIIGFTKDVDVAFKLMLKINETYQLDGRGPTGIVGILWNFGLHDRAWFDRDVFGKLRYMNYNGLISKTNILEYIDVYKNEKSQ